MSVATTRPAQSSSIRIPVLTPLYGAPHESFYAQADGTYLCGSAAVSEFSLEFSGAEAAHCSFIRQAGTFSVNRLEGRVWINDLPVSGINRLREGDVISLGPVSYRLDYQDAPSYLPEPHVRPRMSFSSAANARSGSLVSGKTAQSPFKPCGLRSRPTTRWRVSSSAITPGRG